MIWWAICDMYWPPWSCSQPITALAVSTASSHRPRSSSGFRVADRIQAVPSTSPRRSVNSVASGRSSAPRTDLGEPQWLDQVVVDHRRVVAGADLQADGEGCAQVVHSAQVAEITARDPAGVKARSRPGSPPSSSARARALSAQPSASWGWPDITRSMAICA